jgi:hypothetical protein
MWPYYKRVLEAVWIDFKTATKEQMLGALLAIAILICQIIFGVVHKDDVRGSVWSLVWPYLGLLFALFFWHLLRAPYKLSLIDANLPRATTFKAELYELAEAVSKFAFERSENAPAQPVLFSFGSNPMQSLAESNAKMEACRKWDEGTLGMYEYRFSRKVVTAVEKLSTMNPALPAPDDFWQHPKNCNSIKAIGKMLANLGDQIVDE